MISIYDKIQNACFQLNHDAWLLQSKKKIRQFNPCAKARVLLKSLDNQSHFESAMTEASTTPCNCHNSLSLDGLYAMCFDDTSKNAH